MSHASGTWGFGWTPLILTMNCEAMMYRVSKTLDWDRTKLLLLDNFMPIPRLKAKIKRLHISCFGLITQTA